MPKNKIIIPTILGLLLLSFLLLRFLGAEQEPTDDEAQPAVEAPPAAADAAPRPAVKSQEKAAPVALASEDPELQTLSAAYDLLAPKMGRIRCDSSPLAEGDRLRVRGFGGPRSAVPFGIDLHNGSLTAAVGSPSGEALLTKELIPIAVLEWDNAQAGSWGECRIREPRLITVKGKVEWPAGAPAADAQVRGCRHRDIVQADGDGSFSFRVEEGARCTPFAFVESEEGRFGRGPVTRVDTNQGPTVEGVRLLMPLDKDVQSIEQQRAELVKGLGFLNQRQLKMLERPSPMDDALKKDGIDPEVRATIARWGETQKSLNDERIEQLETLMEGGDEVNFRDLWLGMTSPG